MRILIQFKVLDDKDGDLKQETVVSFKETNLPNIPLSDFFSKAVEKESKLFMETLIYMGYFDKV